MRLARELTWRLRHPGPGGPREALRFLVRSLEARGASLIRAHEAGSLVVLDALGKTDEQALAKLEIWRNRSRRREESRLVLGPSPPSGPSLSWALAFRELAGETLGLALWGARAREPEVGELLRIFLSLIDPPESGAATVEVPTGLRFPEGHLPGIAPSMTALYRQLEALAPTELPILILGETGVGKEAIARTLADSSRRQDRPFLAMNCAAIPSELLEAELFGIAGGVATGVRAREGLLRRADGGTLFLDEIGDMPLGLQAKLLRALQEKVVQPVGGQPVPIELRIVAATHSDLDARIDEGSFRSDLYYRLAARS